MLRHGSACLAGLLLACSLATAGDPLRLVPAQADVFIKVEQPARLVEVLTGLEAVRELNTLEGLREYYDSTNFRRLYQLVGYFSKKLGASREELLDRLAGGGAVLASHFGVDPAPTVLVVEGKDEKLVQQFAVLAVDLIEQELARQESKERLEKAPYRGIDGFRVAGKFYFAAVGATMIVANNEKAMQAALDLAVDGDAGSALRVADVAAGRKLLAGQPLAWFWINFEKARADAKFKVGFDTFTKDPGTIPFVGGVADVARRSPFFCAGLFHAKEGFTLSVRFPRGRDGMSELARLVLPDDERASLPLLEPKNVILSTSYFVDLKRYYEQRDKFLNPKQQQNLAKLEKNTKGLLPPARLEELVRATAPHQRFVLTHQDGSIFYTTKPRQRFGAFALVQETRDPAFGKTMDPLLRAAALVGAFQYNLKLVEEKHGAVTLVGYRFPDPGEMKADVANIRYNFSPCYAQVGNQFFISSTVELGRELIELLQKEPTAGRLSPAVVQMRFFWSGLAANLRSSKEQIVGQAILNQALIPETARQQADLFIRLVDRLGTVRFQSSYHPTDTRYELRLILASEENCCGD